MCTVRELYDIAGVFKFRVASYIEGGELKIFKLPCTKNRKVHSFACPVAASMNYWHLLGMLVH